jgi:hypothetical protein
MYLFTELWPQVSWFTMREKTHQNMHHEDIAADILIYMVHMYSYNSLCICVHRQGFDYTSWYKARVTDLGCMNRSTCNTPCIYLLNCGHRCPGLQCEKKRIRTCKVCDHDKLTEIFFGTEDEEDAVFIQLEDCVCIFEVTGFDNYVKTMF